MGGELVTGSSSNGGEDREVLTPLSYTEVFEEQLPFYLSIGMTWDEFWHDDVTKVKFYRKAFQLKADRRNQELWLLGAYVYDSLCRVSPIFHDFAKRGTKPMPYVEKPYSRESEKKQTSKNERETEKEKMESNMAKVMAWLNKTQ